MIPVKISENNFFLEKELQRFSIIEATREKILEKETVKVLNTFEKFHDYCTVRKNQRFDFSLTSTNGGNPYLVNGMNKLNGIIKKSLNFRAKKSVLISKKIEEGDEGTSSYTFLVNSKKNSGKIVSVEPEKDSMFINLLDKIGCEIEIPTVKTFQFDSSFVIQVTRKSLLVVNQRYLNLACFKQVFPFVVKNCFKVFIEKLNFFLD